MAVEREPQNQWFVITDYPFSWSEGFTTRHSTEEKAREYASGIAKRSTPDGTNGYIRVIIAKAVEEVN